jgi:putative salt-induced outer membrane protein YdiY
MKSHHIILSALLAASLVSVAPGDVVETKSGAHLVGKVTQIDGDTVYLSTDYAGDLKVKKGDVTKVSTDHPISVRLTSGTVLAGTLEGSGNGNLVVTGADASLTTDVSKVAATWMPGDQDPAVVALQRAWTYEVAADITGKSGNKDQLGTSFSARAIMKTSQDTLQFYTGYDRQISDGEKSADQLKVGIDYQNNFSGKTSWYVRDEGGFDRIKDINLYNVAGAGIGYDVIKEPKHTLTLRGGLAYRYEGYKNPLTEDVSAPGLDLGLSHTYEAANWSLVNRLSIVPLFEDFANFRIQHESFFEIPLANPDLKLRLGVSNDYHSRPGDDVKKLDTTYFTRLVLSWK